MATIAEQLTQLQADKETLKTNLIDKEIEVLDTDTFTELSAKVADIQVGEDLSEYIGGVIKGGSAESGWHSNFIKFPALASEPNETTFAYMYSGCPATIIDISKLDWSKLQGAISMFQSCKQLTTIIGLENEIYAPELWSCQSMFSSCEKLVDIDLSKINITTKLSNVVQRFMSCDSLESVNMSTWNLGGVTKVSNIFHRCTKLTNLQFGTNLGAAYDPNIVENYSYYSLDLSNLTLLTEESLISVLNGLADIKSLGVKTQQCILGETNLAKLTSEAGQQALAQAQAYGWTVSQEA